MADLHHMAGKFGVAVHMMATSEGTLRERVYDAYVESARLGTPELGGGHAGAEPSPALAQRIRELEEMAAYDGTYDTSFAVKTDGQIQELAEEIYSINLAIQGELLEGHGPGR